MDKGGLVWGAFLQQLLALDQSHFQTSLCPQALVAVRRVLLAQFSAFPANGADLYEELKSSTAILPTGSPRWVPHPPTSSSWGWLCCTRLWLPAQALNFSLQTIPMHLYAFGKGTLRTNIWRLMAPSAPAILAAGVLIIIPPCVHPIAWTSCWTRGCTRGK